MKYDVLTFDTQAVSTNGFDFDGGWLAQVKQFKDGPTGVVVSSVVAREIRKHLADKIRQAKDKFEAAAKDALHYGLDAPPLDTLTLLAGTPRELATKRVKAYLDAIGAQTVPVTLISVEQLMGQYFKPAPPFTAVGKKKSEFPDAVALMTLDAWARKEGKHVLAVSGDGDWSAFAEKSHYIDVVQTLEEALALLQEHAVEGKAIVETLLAEIDKEGSAAAVAFEALLEVEVANANVDPELSTSQEAEVEGGELSLKTFTLAGTPPEFDFTLVRAGPWILSASIELLLKVDATAYVSFFAWDSIDKESIPLGGLVAAREIDDLPARVIATWSQDLLEAEWSLISVELVSVDDPDLGYVEMDWGDDGEGEEA